MSDNLGDLEYILPRITTDDLRELNLDLNSWSDSNQTELPFLAIPPDSDPAQRDIKTEPSSHSSAEYDGFSTMALQNMNSAAIQHSVQTVPSNKDFAGDYNFDLKVACSKLGQQKPQVTYSQKLNKAFINMGHTLPIDFFWNPMIPGLFVRATMLYSSPHDAPNLVMRCKNHKTMKSSDNLDDFNNSDHVLLCKSVGAQYFGSVDSNTHLNVTVPLGNVQTGDCSVRVLYEFACKHSCVSGMNRRSVECVFTLENLE
ncbi:cellular tumor antigen p53-like [Ctenocephalides felis]|uniref:cellular tumor antigen p53-like n=1 Tax=Ctenocephalides felis TaxID=7515 RepID=UPI000E6E3369|nr:cellular tumor antigen p53-like [Ctenocephalides felis]